MMPLYRLVKSSSIIIFIILNTIATSGHIESQEQYFVDDTPNRLPPYEDSSYDGDLGDINSNGFIDLVISNSVMGNPDTANLLLINLGSGNFVDSTEGKLPTISMDLNHSDFLDIERDDDLDIYLSNSWNRDYLFVNDGSGNFTDESERIPLDEDSRSKEADYGDIEGDLDLDIIVAEFNSRFNRLLINNGNGFYSSAPPSRFPSGRDNTNEIVFGDVDGDFDLDVVVANNTGNLNRILINDSNGYFTDETDSRAPEDGNQSNGLAIGDIDNDGDLDVYFANGWSPGFDRLWINNGLGYFTDESEERTPFINNVSSDVTFGDIDNDGDLDILTANDANQGFQNTNKVYINDGSGFFTDETEQRLPDNLSYADEVVLGDVDLDGDLDLFIINKGKYPDGEQNRLFINISTPDSFPPTIPRTYHHPDTGDTTNSYLITTTAWDNISVVIGELNVSLFYRSMSEINDADFTELSMLDCGGFLFRENIPAQSSISTVEYYIKAEDRMGNFSFDPLNAPDSVFSFVVDVSVGINDNPNLSPNLPRAFSLSQNYPNPFNPSTTIDYSIPEGEAEQVQLLIYDLRGRLIRSLINEEKSPGSYSVHWDGRSNEGREIGSGVYLYRIEAGSFVSIKKMIITR